MFPALPRRLPWVQPSTPRCLGIIILLRLAGLLRASRLQHRCGHVITLCIHTADLLVLPVWLSMWLFCSRRCPGTCNRRTCNRRCAPQRGGGHHDSNACCSSARVQHRRGHAITLCTRCRYATFASCQSHIFSPVSVFSAFFAR